MLSVFGPMTRGPIGVVERQMGRHTVAFGEVFDADRVIFGGVELDRVLGGEALGLRRRHTDWSSDLAV